MTTCVRITLLQYILDSQIHCRSNARRAYFCCRLFYAEQHLTTTTLNRNERGNIRIHVTLGRVRVTIVAAEKQEVLRILSVCLYL